MFQNDQPGSRTVNKVLKDAIGCSGNTSRLPPTANIFVESGRGGGRWSRRSFAPVGGANICFRAALFHLWWHNSITQTPAANFDHYRSAFGSFYTQILSLEAISFALHAFNCWQSLFSTRYISASVPCDASRFPEAGLIGATWWNLRTGVA